MAEQTQQSAQKQKESILKKAEYFVEGVINDDDKSDLKMKSFLDALHNSFTILYPADNHSAFIQFLQEEASKINKNLNLEFDEDKMNGYIQKLINETKNEQNTIETQDTIEKVQQEIKEVSNLSPQESYELLKEQARNEFIDNHYDELKSLEVIKNLNKEQLKAFGGEQFSDDLEVVSERTFLSKEDEEKLKESFLATPLDEQQNFFKQHQVFSVDKVKDNIKASNEFINALQEEKANINDRISLEAIKKGNLNPDTYYTDLTNWFENKRIENLSMPISKDEFKQSFYEYYKNGMSENEMKILLILSNKEPTILTKEHKDMLKEGLKLNLQNKNLLDNGLDSAIRADIGESITNAQIQDFTKTIIELSKTQNLIDKRLCEDTTPKLAKKILDSNKNLSPANADTLKAMIANKPIQTKKATMGLKR